MRIERILVPTDFSRASVAALDAAIDFASLLHAEIVLAHVCDHRAELVAARSRDTTELYRSLRVSVEQELALQRHRAEAAGVLVTTVVRDGKPAREILRLVTSREIDRVVMGTNGRHGARRLFLGSVAEEVARRSDVPVVTVRASRPRRQSHLPPTKTDDVVDLADIA